MDKQRLRELGAFDSLFRSILLIALTAPLIVKFSQSIPTWDELYYLHRAVCVNFAFFSSSIGALGNCISAASKAPFMAGLLIPAGPIDGDEFKLNVAWLVLVFSIFLQILVLANLTMRLRIPLFTTLLASLAIYLNPQLYISEGAFLSDWLLAFTVLNTLLLFALEATTQTTSDGDAALRGVMWGIQGSIGILTKLTYGYFGLLLVVPAIWLSRKAPRETMIKVTSAAIVGAAPASLFLAYADNFLHHAIEASFGQISKFYSDNLSVTSFMWSDIHGAGLAWIMFTFIGLQAALRRGYDAHRLWTAGYLLIAVVGYFVIASLSVNRDPRFFLPVWTALPWCIALAVAPKAATEKTSARIAIVQVLLIVLLLLPTVSHFDFHDLDEARAALRMLPNSRKATILLASDEPGFNVETLILARELNYTAFRAIDIGTVVYDLTKGLTVEQSIERLLAADYVILRYPIGMGAPKWTNSFYDQFLTALREHGKLIGAVGSSQKVLVFAMRHT